MNPGSFHLETEVITPKLYLINTLERTGVKEKQGNKKIMGKGDGKERRQWEGKKWGMVEKGVRRNKGENTGKKLRVRERK